MQRADVIVRARVLADFLRRFPRGAMGAAADAVAELSSLLRWQSDIREAESRHRFQEQSRHWTVSTMIPCRHRQAAQLRARSG